MRNALQRFMYGRYGNDQFNLFLMVSYLVLYVLFLLIKAEILYYLSLALMIYTVYRMLSRDLVRRREENRRFLRRADPVIRWFRLRRTIRRDKEHCYFKCPNCSQYLRVPRGKGKITVSCRSCHATFQEKT